MNIVRNLNYIKVCLDYLWSSSGRKLCTPLPLVQCLSYGRFFTSSPKMSDETTLFRIRARDRKFKGFEKEEGSTWEGPFSFIQAADTQFGMIESYLEKRPDPRWDEEIELTKQAITKANGMSPKPRFFIVCGDLVDAFPGTKLREPQEKDFKSLFAELDPEIPLVCVCGNHDLGNTPTHASVKNYRDKFGDDYFTFWCGGVMFLVLNSQFYEDPSLVQDLAEEQEAWLDKQLEEAKNGNYKHIVVFQHIPWFLRHPDEEKEYFNIEVPVRQRMLQKFYAAGVRSIFCGHYHRNAGGMYKDMEVIVTSAIGAQLGNDGSGMRVVRVLDNAIKHAYYKLEDLPSKINLDK